MTEDSKNNKFDSDEGLSYIDKLMKKQSNMINDIEKHCIAKRNRVITDEGPDLIKKRMAKYIYKMDCNKYYKRNPNNDNSVTVASSDYKKLPRVSSDPVIEY